MTIALLAACGQMGLTPLAEPVSDWAGGPEEGARPSDEEQAEETVREPLQGMTYRVDWTDLVVTEPPAFGFLLDQMDLGPVLIHVVEQRQGGLDLAMALAGEDGLQSECEPVHALPEASWTNPHFSVDANAVNLTVGGRIVQFQTLLLEGDLTPDASEWTDGVFETEIDTRQLSRVVPEGTDVCGLLEAADSACYECADGVEACATLRMEEVLAEQVDIDFDVMIDGQDC